MTSQERLYRSLHYQPVDHVFDREFRYWMEIPGLWEREGLPPGLDTDEKLELYFGLASQYRIPVKFEDMPQFTTGEIERRNGNRYYYDEDHVLCRVPDDGLTTMPEHLEYPLKSRKDWETVLKPHYDHDTPGRIPENLPALIDDALSKDYMLRFYIGSLFGRLRNYAGFERICYMIYDDPKLVDDIIGHMTDLICEILERCLPLLPCRMMIADFWEDICFNTGPMVSPAWFREHVVPGYRRIVSVLNGHGIDTVFVDCDGWIGPLIDCWMDAGINVMFPLERAGGSDPVMLRKKYGPGLLLMGGVDKRAIAQGGDAIVRELEYLAPLVEEGGYIPHCDHFCPSDVTLANYRYYLKKKRELFGIPQCEERIRKFPCEP